MHKWTDEQIAFLKEQYQAHDLNAVTELINQRFDLSLKKTQVRAAIKNRKITCPRSGRFVPGQPKVPGSGAKGPNRTTFKKGRPASEASNYLPIGSTRISKDGYIERKVTDDPSLVPARRWVGEHRLVWEAENGPVPEGHAIVFLDGDITNVDISNLRCVHRGVLGSMNKRGLSKGTGEIRKAGILVTELEQAAKQRKSA